MAESAWKNSKTCSISSFDASNETRSNQPPNIPHPVAKTTVAVETSCIDHPPKRTSAKSAIGKAAPSRMAARTPSKRKLVQSVADPGWPEIRSEERCIERKHDKHVRSALNESVHYIICGVLRQIRRPDTGPSAKAASGPRVLIGGRVGYSRVAHAIHSIR
jgi:hypothetical protein